MKSIQVLLVDDEPSVLRGLRMLLGLEADIRVVGEAADGASALDLAGQLSPDVVVMDVNLPVVDGIAATRELVARDARTAVVILSLHDDRATVERALATGAVAFVGKQQPDGNLLAAIRAAADRKGGVLTDSTNRTQRKRRPATRTETRGRASATGRTALRIGDRRPYAGPGAGSKKQEEASTQKQANRREIERG